LTNEAITKYIIARYDVPRVVKKIVSNGATKSIAK